MHYQNVRAAKFIDRPNRFIAHVELDGSVETVREFGYEDFKSRMS